MKEEGNCRKSFSKAMVDRETGRAEMVYSLNVTRFKFWVGLIALCASIFFGASKGMRAYVGNVAREEVKSENAKDMVSMTAMAQQSHAALKAEIEKDIEIERNARLGENATVEKLLADIRTQLQTNDTSMRELNRDLRADIRSIREQLTARALKLEKDQS